MYCNDFPVLRHFKGTITSQFHSVFHPDFIHIKAKQSNHTILEGQELEDAVYDGNHNGHA